MFCKFLKDSCISSLELLQFSMQIHKINRKFFYMKKFSVFMYECMWKSENSPGQWYCYYELFLNTGNRIYASEKVSWSKSGIPTVPYVAPGLSKALLFLHFRSLKMEKVREGKVKKLYTKQTTKFESVRRHAYTFGKVW